MNRQIVGLALLALAALSCTTTRPDEPVNAVAVAYVRLSLSLGKHDADSVDAYYGPEEWRDAAREEKRPLAAIEAEAWSLLERLRGIRTPARDPLEAQRRVYLAAQLGALLTRAEILGGRRFDFDEESRRLYGITAPRHDDAFFGATLEALDAELPGDGPVVERLSSYRNRFNIPPHKLRLVIDRAMSECRARTLARVALPPGEAFTIEYVTQQPWSGYNWYQGKFRSVIQINTDLPVSIERALDLACHEGYPGHHTYNVLLEQNLVERRGWVEFSIYPLFSGQSLVAEGSGNYGLELAFPGEERMRFDRDVLFPLAGLDPAEAERFHRVLELSSRLAYAPNEAARRYLDGAISRDEAIAWLLRQGVRSEQHARQQLDFIERYRSYVITYNVGRDAVKAYVESAPRAQRWRVFLDLISTPRLIGSPYEKP